MSQIAFAHNQSVVSGLKPELVWHYFAAISDIPRASGNEYAIAEYIMNEAAQFNCQAVRDDVGNVIVHKAASSAEYAGSPIVVIQSHMDMVTEKHKNVAHDFDNDPIKFVLKDNNLYADGTTLGADNGIGVAIALAIMASNDVAHGPLELLFTVQEETTFDGAKNVRPESIQGRLLINIDAEEEGAVYIGCAGSGCVIGTLPVAREEGIGFAYARITIDGLRGGHSGVDIDKGRVNALKLVHTILSKVQEVPFRIVSINGGNRLNAIPRDVECVVAIAQSHAGDFVQSLDQIKRDVKTHYEAAEPGMLIELSWLDQEQQLLSEESHNAVMQLLSTIPHGVLGMSKSIENLVETSNNLAKISTAADHITFSSMHRSLVNQHINSTATHIADIFSSMAADAQIEGGFFEWEPYIQSPLLKKATASYKRRFSKDMEIKAIHAGLECGAFVKQIPGLDAISCGPTIHDAHSPNEHIEIDAVQPFWLFLTDLLADLAKKAE